MKRFSELGIVNQDGFSGDKIKIDKILNREITVIKFKVETSKFPKNKSEKYLTLQIEMSETKYVIFSGSDYLMNQLAQVAEVDFPFTATIIKSNEHYEFK